MTEALITYGVLIVLAVVIGLIIGFAAVPGVRRPSPAELLRTAVSAEGVLLAEVSDALRNGVPHPRDLVLTFRAATTARLNLTASGPGPQPSETEREAAEQAANGLGGLNATMAALLENRNAGLALAPAVDEIARWLDPDSPEPGPLTSPDGADSERRLLLDAMTADALAVRAVVMTQPSTRSIA